MKKQVYIILSSLAITFIASFSLYAHALWIQPSQFKTDKGGSLKIKFPNAHQFPATDETEVIDKTLLENIQLVTPEDKSVKLSSWNGNILESKKLNKVGTYIIATVKKGTYGCKTTDGKYEKNKTKEQVADAAICTFSRSFSKAVVCSEKAGGTSFSKAVGHDIEIIPLNDPALLKKGDTISVKVMLNGKPYETDIDTTYEGFKKENEMFALKIKTDKDGIARITLTDSGLWLLKVNNKIPYKDLKKADEQSYNATLSFFIK